MQPHHIAAGTEVGVLCSIRRKEGGEAASAVQVVAFGLSGERLSGRQLLHGD